MPKIVELDTGVYQILNLLDGKRYIGSASSSFSSRWRNHINLLRLGTHYNKHLQRAWTKYGEKAFEFQIILRCVSEDCVANEQKYIDLYQVTNSKNGYNVCSTAGSPLGMKHTSETKKKISEVQKGKKLTAEHIAKVVAIHKGSKRSEETKKRMSVAQKARSEEIAAHFSKYWTGREKSPGSIAKMRATLTGRKLSAEHIANSAKGHLGHLVSDETRAKISKANTGKVRTLENRIKISRSLTGKKLSEETKVKLRIAQRNRRLQEKLQRELTA